MSWLAQNWELITLAVGGAYQLYSSRATKAAKAEAAARLALEMYRRREWQRSMAKLEAAGESLPQAIEEWTAKLAKAEALLTSRRPRSAEEWSEVLD